MPETIPELKVVVPKNHLIWVDPDEFNALLDAAENMLQFGNIDGENTDDTAEDLNANQILALGMRIIMLQDAIKVFRPPEPEPVAEVVPVLANPIENVLQ